MSQLNSILTVYTPEGALAKLRQGNKRYYTMRTNVTPDKLQGERVKLEQEQNPCVLIVTCSDSRVTPEYIFDLGLGEAYVLRVAGNIISSSELGTIELALIQLNIPLILIMGHSDCQTIQHCLNTMENGNTILSPYVEYMQKKIIPAMKLEKHTREENNTSDEVVEFSLEDATQININHSVDSLINRSLFVQQKIADNQLQVLGVYYDLATGLVDFPEQ